MPRNPNSGRRPGRPPKKIQPDVATLVADLAGLGHSQREVGILLGVDQKTIESRFSAEFEKGKENGKTRLRVKLIAMALAGNITALSLALKNLCGFTDKSSVEMSTPPGNPFVVEDARSRIATLVAAQAARQPETSSPGPVN